MTLNYAWLSLCYCGSIGEPGSREKTSLQFRLPPVRFPLEFSSVCETNCLVLEGTARGKQRVWEQSRESKMGREIKRVQREQERGGFRETVKELTVHCNTE